MDERNKQANETEQKPDKFWESFADLAFQAFRTTGALLIGNSVLIYTEVLGKKPDTALLTAVLGLAAVLAGSLTHGVRRELSLKVGRMVARKRAKAALKREKSVESNKHQSKGDE